MKHLLTGSDEMIEGSGEVIWSKGDVRGSESRSISLTWSEDICSRMNLVFIVWGRESMEEVSIEFEKG